MIKIFFDTNIIQGQMFSKTGEYSLKDFSLNRNIDKIINLLDEMKIRKNVSLIIPEIVIDEIRQHKIESFREHKKEFIETCNKFKQIFGSGITIKLSQIQSETDYIQSLDSSIKNYIKANSSNFKIVKLKQDLKQIINKALNKELMFVSAKGENDKVFTDAGFKDHLVFETIIQESDFDNDMIILFSKDSDFDKASAFYKFKRIDNIESLKSFILENDKEAKSIQILQSFNSEDNKMIISGYCKDHNPTTLVNDSFAIIKIINNDIIIDEEFNECQAKILTKQNSKMFVIQIIFDITDYHIIDAREV